MGTFIGTPCRREFYQILTSEVRVHLLLPEQNPENNTPQATAIPQNEVPQYIRILLQ